jgi:hypothetical protein
LALTLSPAHISFAQADRSASAPIVTAEFLLRFARFTEWPADTLAPDARLLFCTTDTLVAEALIEVTANQTVGTHAVSSRLVQIGPIPPECRVLYAGGLDQKRIGGLLAGLRNTSVLSVGDSEVFTRSGGVIHLYLEDGRMRFAVNLTAAERARLHLSSKMLTFARILRD